MIDALHVGGQRGEPLLEQAFLYHRFGEGMVMDLAALFAPNRVGAVLFFVDKHLFDLHLLKHARRLVQECHPGVAALGAGFKLIVVEALNVRFRESGPLVALMAGLPADPAFPFLPLLGFGPGDIRGGRLAGVRGVLRQTGHLSVQFLDALL